MWPVISLMDNDRIVAVDALAAVFFVDVHHQDCAEHVASAIEHVVSFAGLRAFKHYVDDEGDTRPLTSAAYRSLIAQLRGSAAQGEGGIEMIGDEAHVTGMNIYYFGQAKPNPKHPNWRNVLSFRLSRELFIDRGSAQIKSFMLSLAQIVPFSFAYVSPCIGYTHDVRPAAKIARRFPGFDILKAGPAAASIGNEMAGVYWLSFLGRALAVSFGGAEHLRALLPGVADVTSLPDGKVAILISEEPEVGDVNRKDNLPIYRAVSKALESHLHLPEIVYFFEDDGITPDKHAMVAWHRRFLT